MNKYKQKVFLNGDIIVLDGRRYSADDLMDLPDDLNPRQFSERSNENYYVFGESTVNTILLATGIHVRFNMMITHSNLWNRFTSMLKLSMWVTQQVPPN